MRAEHRAHRADVGQLRAVVRGRDVLVDVAEDVLELRGELVALIGRDAVVAELDGDRVDSVARRGVAHGDRHHVVGGPLVLDPALDDRVDAGLLASLPPLLRPVTGGLGARGLPAAGRDDVVRVAEQRHHRRAPGVREGARAIEVEDDDAAGLGIGARCNEQSRDQSKDVSTHGRSSFGLSCCRDSRSCSSSTTSAARHDVPRFPVIVSVPG